MTTLWGYPGSIVTLGTVAWFLPLISQKLKSKAPQKVDRGARWGIVLVSLGYGIPMATGRWYGPVGGWRAITAAACFVVACGFSWTAARALGRHWRVDAGLDVDHTLVQSGPYRLVRNPIYTSMLFAVAGTCLILAPLSLLPVAELVYLAGTEIRVRAEERLLLERFGDEFRRYRERVPAYLPWRWRAS